MRLELAILVGLPGAGKSTFARERLAGHRVVSKDLMPRRARNKRARQARALASALAGGAHVVLDNTSPAAADRAEAIALARARGARVVAYVFEPDLAACRARNAARERRVPEVALFVARKRFERPTVAEGFDEIRVVALVGGGFVVTRAAQGAPGIETRAR